MHDVFVSLPTVRGIHPDCMWGLFNCRTELEKAGHRLHGSSIYRNPLDLARNEGMTVFLSTTCGINLMVDDDVCLSNPADIVTMVRAIDGGCDIVSAPCKMRGGDLFNIVPTSEILTMGGVRVVECAWTGLGIVMVARRVFEKLHADAVERDAKRLAGSIEVSGEPETYRSLAIPDRVSAAIFKSMIIPERMLFPEAPEGANTYQLDDRAFSRRAHDAGFKIHAAIDVGTVHDGLAGCFSQALEALDRARQAQAEMRGPKPKLMGPDGRPARTP